MKRIILFALCGILLSGCAIKMKGSKLLNIINNDKILYVWEGKGSLNLAIYNENERLGTIIEKQSGVVSMVYFIYPDGNELMLCFLGDYTHVKMLTQGNDKNVLHLFYRTGISMHNYELIQFNINTGVINKYGLPKGNKYYSF